MKQPTVYTQHKEFEQLLRDRGLRDFTIKHFELFFHETFKVIKRVHGEPVAVKRRVSNLQLNDPNNTYEAVAEEIVQQFEERVVDRVQWADKSVLVNTDALWAECIVCSESVHLDSACPHSKHDTEALLIASLRKKCFSGCPNSVNSIKTQ